jgi:hypothetical protein
MVGLKGHDWAGLQMSSVTLYRHASLRFVAGRNWTRTGTRYTGWALAKLRASGVVG